MKRYLFIRNLPLYDLTGLEEKLNSAFPEMELQLVTFSTVKKGDIQEHEITFETNFELSDNDYIAVGLFIDDFESEVMVVEPVDIVEEEVPVVDKVNMYKLLDTADKENILMRVKSTNTDILKKLQNNSNIKG